MRSDESEFAYRCMPKPRLEQDGLAIRSIQPDHIEPIRQWRNAQIEFLRQTKPIEPEEQIRYFERNVWPDMARPDPANILLAIEEDGALVGYGGLVHVAWEHRRAEVSFLMDPARATGGSAYRRYFLGFLKLLQQLAFEDLGFNRIFAETYAVRTEHMAILEEAGFRREGVMRDHVVIGGRPMDSILHGCVRGVDV